MRDMKYEIHLIAEEIAEREYGCEFYDLPNDKQTEVWNKAEAEWADRQADRSDRMLDEVESHGIILTSGGPLK